jgi:hypothetical protein
MMVDWQQWQKLNFYSAPNVGSVIANWTSMGTMDNAGRAAHFEPLARPWVARESSSLLK